MHSCKSSGACAQRTHTHSISLLLRNQSRAVWGQGAARTATPHTGGTVGANGKWQANGPSGVGHAGHRRRARAAAQRARGTGARRSAHARPRAETRGTGRCGLAVPVAGAAGGRPSVHRADESPRGPARVAPRGEKRKRDARRQTAESDLPWRINPSIRHKPGDVHLALPSAPQPFSVAHLRFSARSDTPSPARGSRYFRESQSVWCVLRLRLASVVLE